MGVPPYLHWFLLGAIPPLVFALAIIQVKRPVITHPSFAKAVREHNKYLVAALTDKPAYLNSSDILLEELGRLRLAMRGQQTGEKTDVKMVLHVSMGLGDSDLPNRIAWLPGLLGCFTTATVATVIAAVYCNSAIEDTFSDYARSRKEVEIGSGMDIVLRMQKKDVAHRVVEETEKRETIKTDDELTMASVRSETSTAPAAVTFLFFVGAILILSLMLEVFDHGYDLANKALGIIRRASSLAPMQCDSVVDYIVLVLNYPTQVIFYLCLGRAATVFNGLFYYFLGNEKELKPMLVTERSSS